MVTTVPNLQDAKNPFIVHALPQQEAYPGLANKTTTPEDMWELKIILLFRITNVSSVNEVPEI